MIQFLKREAVLLVSLLCAVASMFFVPPSPAYEEYINFPVLCILFCLMAVIAGFQSCGLFDRLIRRLMNGQKGFRLLHMILVLLPFLTAMFITNDVALITFVPLTIQMLTLAGQTRRMIFTVTLQTVAANLGSMVTPVGNPQNLFLYTAFKMDLPGFCSAVLPFGILSLLLLVACSLAVPNESTQVKFSQADNPVNVRKLLVFSILFVLCLLTVFQLLNHFVLLGIVLVVLALAARPLYRKIDYSLLLTFVCFFIFSGNMGRIPAVQELIGGLLSQSVVGTAVFTSQFISNVPAAVLLSRFTDDVTGLLVGTNLGGLGTIIASLASLISFKIYLKSPGAKPLRYLGVFTLVNVLGLAVLLIFHTILGTV